MPEKRELYDIWEIEELEEHPWRAQLVNYVGQFLTKEHAERYVAAVKIERAKDVAPEPKKEKK